MKLSKDVVDYLYDMADSDDTMDGLRKQAMKELGALIIKDQEQVPKPPENSEPKAGVYAISYVQDKKVFCIKVVREVMQLGLKEAKDIVEAVIGDHFAQKKFLITLTSTQAFAMKKVCLEYGFPMDFHAEVNSPKEIVRSCFLRFSTDSKTVEVFAQQPTIATGYACVLVSFTIPTAVFEPTILRAEVNLPPAGYEVDMITADLQQALTMSYGQGVKLVVEGTKG